MKPNEWTATGTASNDVATATKSAITNGRHVIGTVIASFSAAAVALLTVKRGTTTVAEHYVHNADVIPLELHGNVNEAVSAELAAGGSGITGKVAIAGYSE